MPLITALVLAAAAALPGEPVLHGPPATARAILAAERAFAARAAAAGTETAFREFTDARDGLSFQGGDPIRGGEAIAKAQAGPAKLAWASAEVFASTGDMGADWGRWTLTFPQGGQITGRYVTVWRRDAKGAWKALFDIGTPDPAPKPANPAKPAG